MSEPDGTIALGEHELSRAKEASLLPTGPLSEWVIPGYVVGEKLGQGSFGEVWAAVRNRTGQKVAVKIFARQAGLDWAYFRHEVDRLGQVAEHPHVVTLLDADFAHDPPYYTMPLHRLSLGEWRRSHTPLLEQTVGWMEQLASALDYTHRKGLLHCDLKPANVLLDQEDQARLCDFGQSRSRGALQSGLGSLGFMAPEQAAPGATPDVRWDLYGLGATVYFLLTAGPPRVSQSELEALQAVDGIPGRLEAYRERLQSHPELTFPPEADADLAQILRSLLALVPENRPESAAAVLEDLKRRRHREPLLCNRPWGPGYRLGRFGQRHPLAILASTVGVLLLSAAFVGLALSQNLAWRKEQLTQTLLADSYASRGWNLYRAGRLEEAISWWGTALRLEPDDLSYRNLTRENACPLVQMFRQGSPLARLKLSPDGPWLVSITENRRVVLFDLSTSQQLGARAGDDSLVDSNLDDRWEPFESAAFGAAGRLATLEPDRKTVRLWNCAGMHYNNSTQLSPLPGSILLAHPGARFLAFSHDGQRLLSLSPERVCIWEASSGRLTQSLSGRELRCAAWSPDGRRLALCEAHGMRILEGSATLAHLKSDGPVVRPNFNADGSALAAVGPGRVYLWQAGQPGIEARPFNQAISARFVTRDRVAVLGENSQLYLWNPGQPQPAYHETRVKYPSDIVSGPHGRFVVYGEDGGAEVWDGEKQRPVSPLLPGRRRLRSAGLLEDAQKVVTASVDGVLCVWQLPQAPVLAPSGLNVTLAVAPTLPVAVVGRPHGEAFLVDERASTSTSLGQAVGGASFSSDRLVVVLFGRTCRLWDVSAARWTGPAIPAGPGLTVARATPDGKQLALAYQNGTVEVRDAIGGHSVWSVPSPDSGPVLWLAWSPDGKLLSRSCGDGTLRTLTREGTEVCLPYRDFLPGRFLTLWYSPSGESLLVNGQRGYSQLVDPRTGRALTDPFLADAPSDTHSPFSPDGRCVVSRTAVGGVLVRDSRTGQELYPPLAHDAPVRAFAWSADSQTLATSLARDGRVQVFLWRVSDGAPLFQPQSMNLWGSATGLYLDKANELGVIDSVGRYDHLSLAPPPSFELKSALDRIHLQTGLDNISSGDKTTLQEIAPDDWQSLRRSLP